MAGDWIKMRTDLYRDPKVCVIADVLMQADGELARYVSQNKQRDMSVTRNVMRNVTVGALVSVWGVMRQRGKRVEDDLVCPNVTLAVIDDIADLPGFGDAMQAAGWAFIQEGSLVFPRFFEEYNVDPEGNSKKSASKAAERQRRFRERQKALEDQESSVTRDVTRDDNSNVTHNVTVTSRNAPREEKRREEKKEEKHTSANADKPPPGFAKFWQAWPATDRKAAKAECAKRWKARGLETAADEIAAHVEAMKATRKWRDGFEPAPLTYLNQRHWEDGLPAGEEKSWAAGLELETSL